jgi:hypothetical protein
MIRGLGTDVGVDHLDLSGVVVEEVPYIFGIGDGGSTTFVGLTDTPGSYEGAGGYIVTVAPGEDGLIFTDPSTIIPPGTQNAYSFIEVPSQPTLTAVGEDTLTIVSDDNITLTTDPLTNTLSIGFIKTGIYTFVPAEGGGSLDIDNRYFITTPGTYILPPLTAANIPGQALAVTKRTDVTGILINVGDPSDIINTDLGPTNSIEYDATDQLIFVVSSENSWELQIGAATT